MRSATSRDVGKLALLCTMGMLRRCPTIGNDKDDFWGFYRVLEHPFSSGALSFCTRSDPYRSGKPKPQHKRFYDDLYEHGSLSKNVKFRPTSLIDSFPQDRNGNEPFHQRVVDFVQFTSHRTSPFGFQIVQLFCV